MWCKTWRLGKLYYYLATLLLPPPLPPMLYSLQIPILIHSYLTPPLSPTLPQTHPSSLPPTFPPSPSLPPSHPPTFPPSPSLFLSHDFLFVQVNDNRNMLAADVLCSARDSDLMNYLATASTTSNAELTTNTPFNSLIPHSIPLSIPSPPPSLPRITPVGERRPKYAHVRSIV